MRGKRYSLPCSRKAGGTNGANGADNEITIAGQYNPGGDNIEAITFADGSSINKAELDALPVGQIIGTEGDDFLPGTRGDDFIQGLGGGDFMDGGPRVHGANLVTGNDTLDGGAGSDSYPIYPGMGQDLIIDTPDGQQNYLFPYDDSPGTLNELYKTRREGNDLTVTLRGATDGVRIRDFFTNGGAAQWRIVDGEGVHALVDFYNAQSAAGSARALEAMADYRAQLLAGWQVGQNSINLPAKANIHATWSQTISYTYQYEPAPLHLAFTQTNTPVTTISVLDNLAYFQHSVSPTFVPYSGNAANISANHPGTTSSATAVFSFRVNGLSGPGQNPAVTQDVVFGAQGFTAHQTTSASFTGRVPLLYGVATLGSPVNGYVSVNYRNDYPVLEDISAGAGANHITGAVDASAAAGNHVALIRLRLNGGNGADQSNGGADAIHDRARRSGRRCAAWIRRYRTAGFRIRGNLVKNLHLHNVNCS